MQPKALMQQWAQDDVAAVNSMLETIMPRMRLFAARQILVQLREQDESLER